MAADFTSDDPAERLRAVREAIAATLSSQEYATGSRRNRRPDLATLRQMEADLIREVEAQGGGFTLGTIAR